MHTFEKVSQSLKYDSKFFLDHKHINIYMDTNPDHFTPLALRVRGNYIFMQHLINNFLACDYRLAPKMT